LFIVAEIYAKIIVIDVKIWDQYFIWQLSLAITVFIYQLMHSRVALKEY